MSIGYIDIVKIREQSTLMHKDSTSAQYMKYINVFHNLQSIV